MKNKRLKNKKGISTLVATVLLIVITIVAVGIIWGAILPLVQKSLGTSSACNIYTKLEIVKQRGMTCYENLSDGNYSVYVEIETPVTFPSKVELKQLNIMIATQQGQIPFQMAEGVKTAGVKMYDGSEDLYLPKQPGSSKVYNITVSSKPSQVAVSPVVKIGEQSFVCEPVQDFIDHC